MLYFLVPVVELLIVALVIIAGLKIYKLYSKPTILKDRSNIKKTKTIVTQRAKPKAKNPNAVLDDYIGDFF